MLSKILLILTQNFEKLWKEEQKKKKKLNKIHLTTV